MIKKIEQNFIIPEQFAGLRLDQALAKIVTDYSRTEIQAWLKNGEISIDGIVPKARTMVVGGEKVMIKASLKEQPSWTAEAIALDIVFEDEALIIINKPAGLVVHPAPGSKSHTLLNAILHHNPDLQSLPRAGIIHRLDKDTTGLLMIAKTPLALKNLTLQLKKRTISRIYQAIVRGVLTSGGCIDQPIGRHPIHRKKMSVDEMGKPAVTHYRILEKFRAYTRVRVALETGRTHQIRVHFAYIRHPLLGDPVYGIHHLPKGASSELIAILRQFKRQALHAESLEFIHPLTHQSVSFHAPLPEDMNHLIKTLREDHLTDKKSYDY